MQPEPAGKLAAACGTAAIGFHVWVAVAQSHSPSMSALMLIMAALCAPCVFSVWRRNTRASMTMLMMLSLGSACAQLLLVFSLGAGTHSGHAVSAALTDIDAVPAVVTMHATLMLLVIVLEFLTAAVAAVQVRRFNAAARVAA